MDDAIRGTAARRSTAAVESRRRGARLHPVPRQKALQSALVLWDHLCLDSDPEPADCIFVMGGHDRGVAEHAARLYRQGVAPVVAVSGGVVNPPSMLEREGVQASEAEELAEVVSAWSAVGAGAAREPRHQQR